MKYKIKRCMACGKELPIGSWAIKCQTDYCKVRYNKQYYYMKQLRVKFLDPIYQAKKLDLLKWKFKQISIRIKEVDLVYT